MTAVVIVVDHPFPSQHAFLEEVYAKRFAFNGHKVVWVFRRSVPGLGWTRTTWHGTSVYLAPNEGLCHVFLRPLLNVMFLLRFLRLVRSERVRIVQVRNWIWAGYCALVVSRLLGLPFVFQWSIPMQDGIALLLSRERPSLRLSYKRAKNRWRRMANEFLMRRADRVFPVSDEMRCRMLARGFKGTQVVTVPLGCVPEDRRTAAGAAAALREDLGLAGRLVVGYVGSLHWTRQPEFMIRMFQLVARMVPTSSLLLVGGDPEEVKQLKAYAEGLDIDHVMFAGAVPRSRIPVFLSLCDVCVSPFPELPYYETFAPTKLAEYLGAGRAVVGTRIPEQARTLRESEGGVAVAFEEGTFALAVAGLLRDERTRNNMGEKGWAYAASHLSYDVLARQLAIVYQQLSQRACPSS